jgi:hypothetical protein
MADSRRLLFIFLDGVGIGHPDPDRNPFFQARLPNLQALLGGRIPSLDGTDTAGDAVSFPLDPLMGVDGLPQSGTGHTALLTGRNAAAQYGRHFGPWVPVPLRPLMMRENILTRVKEAGISCAFANAYPRQYMRMAWTKRPAGPPLAAQGACVLTRDEEDLGRGGAVASEILNTAWRERLGLSWIPEITPRAGGENLARISAATRLTLFAHYSTDTAGHERSMNVGIAALERVDQFLGGVLSGLEEDTLLLVASDHGNLEDVTQGHTRNPTFNLMAGPGAREAASGLSSICDLAPAVLSYLNVDS